MEAPETVPPITSSLLPPLSEAVCREIEALRAMLGLPPEESEADESAPPEPMQPGTLIPSITDTSIQP